MVVRQVLLLESSPPAERRGGDMVKTGASLLAIARSSGLTLSQSSHGSAGLRDMLSASQRSAVPEGGELAEAEPWPEQRESNTGEEQ